ncbi:MAG TPA: ABC transporter permease [Kofleriaceae bacterium]
MRNLLVVARRELLERIKTKWFLAVTLLGPLFMVAIVVLPVVIAGKSSSGTRIDIVDKTGVLATPLQKALTDKQWIVNVVAPDTTDEVELKKIKRDQINGFLVIPKEGVTTSVSLYRGDNASSQFVAVYLQQAMTNAVNDARADLVKLSTEQRTVMSGTIQVATLHSTGEAEASSGLGAFFLAYALAFILYIVITLYGVNVMRSVVQEKTSRVMEFLVAVVKPRDLLGGKILGVGGAAMLQLTVWLGFGFVALTHRNELLGVFGIGPSDTPLPSFAFGDLIIVLAFFVVGFFFYASMYAAVGAMVSSEQDTQQVQMPITMLLIIGVMCFQLVTASPRGTTTTVLTHVPFWSPILMPMRFVLGGASLGEVLISLGILIVTTLLVVRAAAKIYRVGVLLYGKRPTLSELVRWLRH